MKKHVQQDSTENIYQRADIIAYSLLLMQSFERYAKQPLLANASDHSGELSKQLYHAPFVLVSHDTQDDPVFRYANQMAQELWRMDWQTITRMPSRLTARPDAQADRERLLCEARENGCVKNYSGVRVTSDGKLFFISETILWNVEDESGKRYGQAAMFTQWKWIDA